MHFQYLVEDQSGAALIRILMQKIVELYPNATYDCKGFRGIGGFTRKNTIKETKTGKLLNDLATYLRGFDRSLQSFPSVIIVVLDTKLERPSTFIGGLLLCLCACGIVGIFITGNPITTLESKIE